VTGALGLRTQVLAQAAERRYVAAGHANVTTTASTPGRRITRRAASRKLHQVPALDRASDEVICPALVTHQKG